jgi:glutathione S-transferase
MTAAKFYYYSATGRGHAIRLALSAANIEFEDIVPTCGFPPNKEQIMEWRKLGRNTTTNIPMLEMPNGKVYTQSSAILRAVGRMSRGGNNNLMPDSDDDLDLMDKLIADAEDLRSCSYKCFVTWGAPKEKFEKFIAEELPLHFGNFERQLIENDGEFFVGKNSLTIADVTIYDAVTSFGTNRAPKDCLEKFPNLAKWIKRVESNPGIASYLAGDKYADLEMKFDENC